MAKKVALKKKKISGRSKTSSIKAAPKRKPKVQAIPKGYQSITPYLIVNNATKAITFYQKAFGAKEVVRMEHSSGRITHAELKIGDAKVMLADEFPEMGARGPQAMGGSPVIIRFYTKNVDEVVAKAVSAGASLLRPVEDMFYGDRCGMIDDPFGHKWHVSTHIEDLTLAKIKKRAVEFYNGK